MEPRPSPRRALALTLLLPLAAVGCERLVGPGPDAWSVVPLDAEVVDAYTGFGLRLFRELGADDPEGNIFISPTSAAIALAMTYNGAEGETREAMARTLGVEHLAREQLNLMAVEWLGALARPGRQVELAVANSIWIRQGLGVLPGFLAVNRESYGAEARELDFADPGAPAIINRWVSDATRGRIPEVIESIEQSDVMFLINALFFEGRWTHAFDAKRTATAPFTLPDGSTRQVPMMRQDREFQVTGDELAEVALLPYGNERFAMLLALPREGRSLTELREGLSVERLRSWTEGLAEGGSSRVSLPRFSLEWESDLVGPLERMGMGVAFSDAADFSSITGGPDLFVSGVLQKTFLEVDEAGTTAAAVTVVTMGVTSAPRVLTFDRPFLLAIWDHATSTLLFLGQIADPS